MSSTNYEDRVVVHLEQNTPKLQMKRHNELKSMEDKIYCDISEKGLGRNVIKPKSFEDFKTMSLKFGGNITNNKPILTNDNISYFSSENSVVMIDLINQKKSQIRTAFSIDKMFYIEDDANDEYYLLFKSAGNYFYMYRITNNTFGFVKSFYIQNLFYVNSFGRRGELCFVTWEEIDEKYYLTFFLLRFLFDYNTTTSNGKDVFPNTKEPANTFYYFHESARCEFDENSYPHELKEWHKLYHQKRNKQTDSSFAYNNEYRNNNFIKSRKGKNTFSKYKNENKESGNPGVVVRLQMCEIVRMKYFYFCMVHMNKQMNKLVLANNNFIMIYNLLNNSYKVIFFTDYISCVKISDENFLVVGFVNGNINIIFFNMIHVEKELMYTDTKNKNQRTHQGNNTTHFTNNEIKKIEEYKRICAEIKPFQFDHHMNTLQESFPYIANYIAEDVVIHENKWNGESSENSPGLKQGGLHFEKEGKERKERKERNEASDNIYHSPNFREKEREKEEMKNGMKDSVHNVEKEKWKKRKIQHIKEAIDVEDGINPIRFINFAFDNSHIAYIETFSILQYKWHSHSVYNIYFKKKQIVSVGEEGVIMLYDIIKGTSDFITDLDSPCHELLIKKKRNLVICQMLDNSVTFLNYINKCAFFDYYGINTPLVFSKLFGQPKKWRRNVKRNVKFIQKQMSDEMDYYFLTDDKKVDSSCQVDLNVIEEQKKTQDSDRKDEQTYTTYHEQKTVEECGEKDCNKDYENDCDKDCDNDCGEYENDDEEEEEEMDVINKEEDEEIRKRTSIKRVQKKLEEKIYQLGRYEKNFYKSYLMQLYCDSNEGFFFSLLTDFKSIQLYNVELDQHISYISPLDIIYKSRTDDETVNDMEIVTYSFSFDREYLLTIEKRNYLTEFHKNTYEKSRVVTRHTIKLWRLARNCIEDEKEKKVGKAGEENYLNNSNNLNKPSNLSNPNNLNNTNNINYPNNLNNLNNPNYPNNPNNLNNLNYLNGFNDPHGIHTNAISNHYKNANDSKDKINNKNINNGNDTILKGSGVNDDYEYKMIFNSAAHNWSLDFDEKLERGKKESKQMYIGKERFVKVLFHPVSNIFIVLDYNGSCSIWILYNGLKLFDKKVLSKHKAIFFHLDAFKNHNGIIYTLMNSIYNTEQDLGVRLVEPERGRVKSSDSSGLSNDCSSDDDASEGKDKDDYSDNGSSVDSIMMVEKKKNGNENENENKNKNSAQIYLRSDEKLDGMLSVEEIKKRKKMLTVIKSVNYNKHRILSGDISESGEYFCLLHEQIVSVWQLFSLSVHFVLTHPVYTFLENDILNTYKGLEIMYQKHENYVCLYLYDSIFIYCLRNAVFIHDKKFNGIIEYVKFDKYSCKFLAIGLTKKSRKNPNVLVQYNYIYEFNQHYLKKRKMFYSSIRNPLTTVEFAPVNKYRNKSNLGNYKQLYISEDLDEASILVTLNAKLQLQVFYFNNLPKLLQIELNN